MSEPRRVAVMLQLEWPYKRHTDVFTGAQQYAREHGWHSVIDEFADAKPPAGHVPYDGILARATTKLAKRASREGLPVVNVWFSSPAWQKLPGVFPDHAAIGRLRAQHLQDRGFSRFACLTTTGDRSHEYEKAGFLAALDELGNQCLHSSVPADCYDSVKAWREAERTITAWIEEWEPPIGVFVAMESLGRVVAQICQNTGLRVPEDVAIIAGSNEEHYCEGLQPSLTSVEAGFTRVGYEAARLLDRLMDGEPAPDGPILLPPQGLVVRESTDFFAVEEPLLRRALEYIAANSSRSIGPEDVAKALKTGTRTLQRRFKSHLNRTIGAEIRRVRTERAKRELVQTNRSVTEIARLAGFGEAMRMYEVFRRELGLSPSEYRQQNTGESP